MIAGDALDLAGGGYGHIRGIGVGGYEIGKGILTFAFSTLGSGVRSVLSALVMPRLGSHGGLNWPGTGDNSGYFPETGTQVNEASIQHDGAVSVPGGFLRSANHFNWIVDAWAGPGIQPGLYGQAYRLIGTVGFGAAGGGLRLFGY